MFPKSYKNQENVEKGFVLNLAKEHLRLDKLNVTIIINKMLLPSIK